MQLKLPNVRVKDQMKWRKSEQGILQAVVDAPRANLVDTNLNEAAMAMRKPKKEVVKDSLSRCMLVP